MFSRKPNKSNTEYLSNAFDQLNVSSATDNKILFSHFLFIIVRSHHERLEYRRKKIYERESSVSDKIYFILEYLLHNDVYREKSGEDDGKGDLSAKSTC